MEDQNPFVEELSEKIASATGLDQAVVISQLATPPREEMGEYAFPCFTLAKQWRKNPTTVAQEVADKISLSADFKSLKAEGPYINFTTNHSLFIAAVLGKIAKQGESYGSLNQGRGKTVVIDFSSPNLAKPFSIAHLRSTAIGNAIYKIHEFLGWQCVGINHLGDWGTNWGQLLAAYKKWGDPEKVRANPVPELLALYTRFNEELGVNPELQEEAREYLERLEAGNPESRALWAFFAEEGYKEAQRIYEVLGVRFDLSLGESFFADKVAAVIERFREKGLVVESEGALVVMLDEWGMAPVMLRTSRGTSTYHSRDLAALFHRHEQFAFDEMVYVTDVSQSLHFKQLFKALELLGVDWWERCAHASFGLMSLKGGKMSTRRGNMVFLEDVLSQAIKLTQQIIAEKNPDLADKDEVARQVGISAVIFADLDTRRIRNVVFDWDQVLNFDGETGPYLQYTHARLCSILRKVDGEVNKEADLSGLDELAELRVARKLEEFPRRLEQAAEENEPSLLSTYLLELATAANKFYNEVPVLAAEPTLAEARLVLVDGVRAVLRTGLSLLGMKAPEVM